MGINSVSPLDGNSLAALNDFAASKEKKYLRLKIDPATQKTFLAFEEIGFLSTLANFFHISSDYKLKTIVDFLRTKDNVPEGVIKKLNSKILHHNSQLWSQKITALVSQVQKVAIFQEVGTNLQQLLTKENVNKPSFTLGATVVHRLAKSRELDRRISSLTLFEEVAKIGGDFNKQDDWGNTPLIWAIANANNSTAKKLIELTQEKKITCNLNAKTGGSRDNSALHLAVAKGYRDKSADGAKLAVSNRELVELLLKSGAEVDIQDHHLNTPLHLACIRRDFEMAQLLIKYGADRTKKNRDGKTPSELLDLSFEEAYRLIADATGSSDPASPTTFRFEKKEYESSENLAAIYSLFY